MCEYFKKGTYILNKSETWQTGGIPVLRMFTVFVHFLEFYVLSIIEQVLISLFSEYILPLFMFVSMRPNINILKLKKLQF